jgi:hypothetical protein
MHYFIIINRLGNNKGNLMSRIKRALCLIVVFVMTAGFMVGCALFERDVDYYNNMVVAKVGKDIRITKGQLVTGFNTFGFQYVTQQGLTEKEAYDKTLNDLIDREILVELSIRDFSYLGMSETEKANHIKTFRATKKKPAKKGAESLYYDALYENEKAEVRKRAFDSLNDYYKELQDKVREERKVTFNDSGDGQDPNIPNNPAPDMAAFSAFEPFLSRNLEQAAFGGDPFSCPPTCGAPSECGVPCGIPATPRVAPNTVFGMDISAHVEREVFTELRQGKLFPLVSGTWDADIDKDGDHVLRAVKSEALSRLVRVLGNNERGIRNVGTAEAVLVEPSDHLELKERAMIGRELGRMIEDISKTVLLRRHQDVFELGLASHVVTFKGRQVSLFDRTRRMSSDANSADFHRMVFETEAEYRQAILTAASNNPTNTGRANRLSGQARNFYRSQVLMQYSRFVREVDTVASLTEKVVDSLDGIYWLPTEVAQNHFTVSHILIQYNDRQKEEFEEIKAEFAQGGYVNINTYQNRMNDLAAKLSTRARDVDGQEYGEARTALQIRDEIEIALGASDKRVVPVGNGSGGWMGGAEILVPGAGGKSEQDRVNIFRDFIYKYNQDPGMSNAEFEYVMGIKPKRDAGGNIIPGVFNENSKMVPEFTNAANELFGYVRMPVMSGGRPVLDDKKEPVYDWVKREGRGLNVNYLFEARKSSMSYDLVMSDFGAHIVMYTRDLTDFIYHHGTKLDFWSVETDLNSMLDNLEPDALNYMFAPLNGYGEQFGRYLMRKNDNGDIVPAVVVNAPSKTWFDVCVDRMTKPDFDRTRASMSRNFKAEEDHKGRLVNKVTIYRKNFRDLYK